MEGTAKNLAFLVDSLPEGSTWSAFGCGPTADLIMAMAITMGGHVRVGMEDNVYISKACWPSTTSSSSRRPSAWRPSSTARSPLPDEAAADPGLPAKK